MPLHRFYVMSIWTVYTFKYFTSVKKNLMHLWTQNIKYLAQKYAIWDNMHMVYTQYLLEKPVGTSTSCCTAVNLAYLWNKPTIFNAAPLLMSFSVFFIFLATCYSVQRSLTASPSTNGNLLTDSFHGVSHFLINCSERGLLFFYGPSWHVSPLHLKPGNIKIHIYESQTDLF